MVVSPLPRLRPVWLLLLLVVCAAALAGCGGIDRRQMMICESVLEALEPERERVSIVEQGPHPRNSDTLVVRYRSPNAPDHWVSCRFGDGADTRFTLVAVSTDRTGALSEVRLEMLRIWLRLRERGLKDPTSVWRQPAAPSQATAPPAPRRDFRHAALFFLQQLVNALVPGCVYGLLAVACTLVFGVLGRVNLALGEVYMIGAFVAVIGVTLLTPLGLETGVAGLLAVLAGAAAFAAVPSFAIGRWVLEPMRGWPGQAPLIATIGLSIALQELVRLLQGAKDRWLPPMLRDTLVLAADGGFSVHLLLSQGLITVVTLVIFWALLRGLRTTGFGRTYRACVDDHRTAALLGINVRRTTGLTFALAGALAGVAGFFVAVYYGGVNFFMGFLIGFKALTAAVVGGIGVVTGAMLGGALIALLETFWSAYLTLAYKEIAVFGLLALFLIFRPHGLLGRPKGRGD